MRTAWELYLEYQLYLQVTHFSLIAVERRWFVVFDLLLAGVIAALTPATDVKSPANLAQEAQLGGLLEEEDGH